MPLTTNASTVAAGMEAVAALVPERVAALTKHVGVLLQARIKSRASGRPGPNIVTGQYVASWKNELTLEGVAIATATVSTDQPQGRRLEYGFIGTDSLGRNYHQPAFPHVGPALDEVTPVYMELLAQIPTLGGE